MKEIWKFGTRWMTVLGLVGLLLISGGCGDDDDDDDDNNDTTPTAFSFTPQTSVAPGSTVTSNTITVSGIDAPATISITGGGTYSINGGTFTSTAGTVTNNQTVAVRQTAPATNSTVATSTLTIGGVSAPFTIITAPPAGADITPATFTIAPRTAVGTGTVVTSDPITVTGIDNPAPITITGGTYSINGGSYTSNAGLVSNGQTVTLRQTASTAPNTATTTTVTIGGVSSDFTTTTAGGTTTDTTPDTFSFTPQTGVALNTLSTSNAVTVSGINAPAPISVTGGTYSINGGAFTATAGTVNNGQTVRVQHTSSGTNSTVTTTTLDIGGVTAPFTTTTTGIAGGDTTPTAFTFTAQNNVAPSTAITSNAITVSGIDAPAPISVTGGTYSINGGAYTSAAGTVSNGQTVTVRHTSSAAASTPTTTTLTIGGVSAAFTSTTQAGATIDAAALYQSRCALCHRLGTIDTVGFAPNLAGATAAQLSARFPTPTAVHGNVSLTTEERNALAAYFLTIPAT